MFADVNLIHVLDSSVLLAVCGLETSSADVSQWQSLVNFLKNIASKDAYFGLLGTVIGATLGFYLTRIAERSRSTRYILQLGWKARLDLHSVQRKMNEVSSLQDRSSYKECVRELFDSLVQLQAHFSLAGDKFGCKASKFFIEKIYFHLNAVVHAYAFTVYDEMLFSRLDEFLPRFCAGDRTRSARVRRRRDDNIFLHEVEKDLK